jgi:hypothetical protein
MNRFIGIMISFLILCGGFILPSTSAAQPPHPPEQYNAHKPPHPLNQHKVPDHTPDSANQGFTLPNGYYGIVYYASSRPELVIPSVGSQPDVTLYAPTVMPGNNSCLEVTIAHFRSATQTTQHGIGFWDWCGNGAGGDGNEGWQNYYDYTPNFLSTYTKNLNWTVDGNAVTNDPTFYIKIQKVNASTCWRGYLWNWITNVWDQKSQACGTNPWNDTTGWAIFESFGWNNNPPGTLPPCFTFNPINSNNRHIHFRRPYVSTNTAAPLNWIPLQGTMIVSRMPTINPCITSDVWHFVDQIDPNDISIPQYWAVVSSP